MALSVDRAVTAITQHSQGLAEAAQDNLAAGVEHCPEWSVADLVHHVTEVHWFWRTIVGERLSEPLPAARQQPRAPDDELVTAFLAGAQALADTLRGADQQAACWTWYPYRQDVGFVTRHQVQEAAVHHWDAVHAARADLVLDTDIAADSVEEFLTCSLADADDADGRPPLGGLVVLRASDVGQAWTVRQREDGELVWDPGVPGSTASMPSAAAASVAMVSGTASDLLLWLYRRIELPVEPDHRDGAALLERFAALSSTD